jgi:lipid II:glycine glycyltransferase (peptidoglycan interpeptide bridge formation enzyme)
MEVKSILTGQRGVSLPFTDYCEPIVTQNIRFQDVFNCLIEYGKQAGWKYVEIRGNEDSLQNLPPSSYYYGHILNLSQNEEQIFFNFRSSTKRNIKKAIREGVKVNIDNSLESIREFYHLNCITRKDHGLPPQPYCFFKNIYDHVVSKNHGFVALASYMGKAIAGAVYFHFGTKAIYKYGASDDRYQHLRANNLVMWEAIKWYCQNGYHSICFGRTEPGNTGLRQFKTGWGAEEKIIRYYKYNLKKSVFMNGGSHELGLHNKVFNKMPIPLLKVVGNLFYKHVG